MSDYRYLIEGYSQKAEARSRLAAEKRAAQSQRDTLSPITASDFMDAAETGGEFPQDVAVHNDRVDAERRDRAERIRMLGDAEKLIEVQLTQLVVDGHHPAFDKLSADMDALMADVRQTAQTLGNVTTFENAYDAGVPEAWKRGEALASQYRDLRSAQKGLTRAVLGSEQAWKVYEVGFVRNSLEQHDGWLRKRQSAASACFKKAQRGYVESYAQWLADGARNRWQAHKSAFPEKMTDPQTGVVTTADPWAYLVWLATEAEAWVPYPATVVKAYELAADAIAEPTVSGVARRRESRAAYFDLIGRTPRLPFEEHEQNALAASAVRKQGYRMAGTSRSFTDSARAHLLD